MRAVSLRDAGWVISTAPLILLGGFLALALHVYVGLGRWPEPMVESYETTVTEALEVFIFCVGVFALYLAGPLWILAHCLRKPREAARIQAIQVAVFCLGWVLVFVIPFVVLKQFTEWFLD